MEEIQKFLDEKVIQYNQPNFIETDPISIPHRFTQKKDIEIIGFLMATISWGKRSSIIQSGEKILQIMNYEPYQYIMEGDYSNIPSGAIYRTFNHEDLLYFFEALKNIYQKHEGLEAVFTKGYQINNTVKSSLTYFRLVFTSHASPGHAEKHLANVEKNSSAKRLNMYLRWMVRQDKKTVDFGLWKNIPASALLLPLDVHTGNVGRKLGILKRKQNDWKSVEEITSVLKSFRPNDPVAYDYALFGLGVFEKF